jgi:hypothetical protein
MTAQESPVDWSPLAIDPAEGRLTGRALDRATLGAIAAVLALFGIGWLGVVPQLPQQQPPQGPRATLAVSDGLPDTLVAGRTYRSAITVTLPKKWYQGTKARLSPATVITIYYADGGQDSLGGNVIIDGKGFLPSAGRVLTMPFRVTPSVGPLVITATVDLSGRATQRQNDHLEKQYVHQAARASGTG